MLTRKNSTSSALCFTLFCFLLLKVIHNLDSPEMEGGFACTEIRSMYNVINRLVPFSGRKDTVNLFECITQPLHAGKAFNSVLRETLFIKIQKDMSLEGLPVNVTVSLKQEPDFV